MATMIWIQRNGVRSEAFFNYEVQVRQLPQELKEYYPPSVSGDRLRMRNDASDQVSIEFRGRALSASSVEFEPAHSAAAGFSLPKGDAIRLAHSILIACTTGGAEGVSVVPSEDDEQPGYKVSFSAGEK